MLVTNKKLSALFSLTLQGGGGGRSSFQRGRLEACRPIIFKAGFYGVGVGVVRALSYEIVKIGKRSCKRLAES